MLFSIARFRITNCARLSDKMRVWSHATSAYTLPVSSVAASKDFNIPVKVYIHPVDANGTCCKYGTCGPANLQTCGRSCKYGSRELKRDLEWQIITPAFPTWRTCLARGIFFEIFWQFSVSRELLLSSPNIFSGFVFSVSSIVWVGTRVELSWEIMRRRKHFGHNV